MSKFRKSISRKLRFDVLKRDGFKCQYCGASSSPDPDFVLEVDHKVPISQGGSNAIDNLVTACNICNAGKSDRGIVADVVGVPLRNAKHEQFAQMVAKGMAGSKAYQAAGYTARGNAAEANASRLLSVAKVASRVEELKAATAELAVVQAAITKADVMRMLRETYDRAQALDQLSAANRSAELLGKEIGMFVERKRIGPMEIADLTDEELEHLALQFEQVRLSRESPAFDTLDPTSATNVARTSGTRTH